MQRSTQLICGEQGLEAESLHSGEVTTQTGRLTEESSFVQPMVAVKLQTSEAYV